MLACDRHDFIHARGLTKNMHDHDPFRFRRDGLSNGSGTDAPRVRLDIDKNRFSPDVADPPAT